MPSLLYLVSLLSYQGCLATSQQQLDLPEDFVTSTHTNNWAVLVDTSRYQIAYLSNVNE